MLRYAPIMQFMVFNWELGTVSNAGGPTTLVSASWTRVSHQGVSTLQLLVRAQSAIPKEPRKGLREVRAPYYSCVRAPY